MNRVLRFTLLGLVVVMAATGCGGGGNSDDEQYASSVCAAIAKWENAMDYAVFEPLKRTRPAPGYRTKFMVFRAIALTRLFTQQLLVKSKRLDAPTDSARHAKVALVTVVGGLDEDLDKLQMSIEKAYGKSPKEPSLRQNARALRDLKYLKTGLAMAWGQVHTVTYAMVYGAPDMKQAFADADTCDGLDSG